jgi:hypothetical protein
MRPGAQAELAQLAEMLGRTLDALDRGELVASPSTRLRIEGAVVALRIVSGDSPERILDALLTDPT